jgi:hypothetical protein
MKVSWSKSTTSSTFGTLEEKIKSLVSFHINPRDSMPDQKQTFQTKSYYLLLKKQKDWSITNGTLGRICKMLIGDPPTLSPSGTKDKEVPPLYKHPPFLLFSSSKAFESLIQYQDSLPLLHQDKHSSDTTWWEVWGSSEETSGQML